MVTKYVLLILLLHCTVAFPKKINLGGLFDEDKGTQRAFELSINAVNAARHAENQTLFANVYLTPESYEIDTDTFKASMRVCDLLYSGVAGIFGPQDAVTSGHVQSLCDTMEMPHITTRWDPSPVRGNEVNLYPHAETLSMVYHHIVHDFGWKSFALLYENTDSLIRTQYVLKRWDSADHLLFLYHLGPGPNYRDVMRAIKDDEVENIVIDCSFDILEEVLKQAQQVGILSDRNRIVVTSLDLQALDLEPYQYSGVNFTGVRLIDPDDPIVQNVMQAHQIEWGFSRAEQLRVEPALTYDAVQLFARAFKQFKDAMKSDVKQLPCNGSESWDHGTSLTNFIRSTEFNGLTGLIKFDTAGFRSDFVLNVIRLTQNGLQKVGVWKSSQNIEWQSPSLPKADAELSLQNRTFIVLISLTDPYGMLKRSSLTMTGNERYEGFGIDIIQELSKMLGFNYTFQVQVDNDYGSYNKETHEWSGMIRKIMDGDADLAITDLTITSERETAVDFTMPFMNLGISILYQKPTKAPPSLFSFLSPFSSAVWLYLIGAYIFVSLLFFVSGRLSPAEWNNPYPCVEEPEVLENQFTLKNSLWFTIGAIMQQGSEIAPIGISTRMMAGCWWFFCLIIVSSYTANLAACLTIETVVPPFSNVEELVKKKTIKYGAKNGGSTYSFFKEASYPTYKTMFEYMQANAKEVLPTNNDDGKLKVLSDDYAFLMESTSIEYIVERECNLTQVGGLLDAKGYGIAMKKHSEHRHALNTAVLKLQESGMITLLKNKWWRHQRDGGKCRESGGQSKPSELGLGNVGGAFLVLTAGVALSVFYTAFEVLWEVGCTSLRDNVPFKEEFMEEVKFIAQCSNGPKPVRRRKGSSNRSGEESTGGCTPPYGFIPTVITTSAADDK